MIRISVTHNVPYVWNAEDACRLREEHRIVGYLVGCLPRWPRQNVHLGLPLRLMPEEASLLVEQGIAYLADDSKPVSIPTEEERQAFEDSRKASYEDQVTFCRERRKAEMVQWRYQIEEGRKKRIQRQQQRLAAKKAKTKQDAVRPKKQKTDTTPTESDGAEEHSCGEEVDDVSTSPVTVASAEGQLVDLESMEESLQVTSSEVTESASTSTDDDVAIPRLQEKHSLVHIPTEKRRTPADVETKPAWRFPETEMERVRYRVYRDLWLKGFYLTSGCKFGGDFLVYAGEPAAFHSQFIAVCMSHDQPLHSLDIITLGRLGSSVNKTPVYCSLDRDNKIVYTAVKWSGTELNQPIKKFGLDFICHSPKV